uniref:Uncharacterized protein n=1 Tax=Arundo donax TaxID=35708 RepID=A0A0A8YXZ0_ARUDO
MHPRENGFRLKEFSEFNCPKCVTT